MTPQPLVHRVTGRLSSPAWSPIGRFFTTRWVDGFNYSNPAEARKTQRITQNFMLNPHARQESCECQGTMIAATQLKGELSSYRLQKHSELFWSTFLHFSVESIYSFRLARLRIITQSHQSFLSSSPSCSAKIYS